MGKMRSIVEIAAATVSLLAVAGWCVLMFQLSVLLITAGGSVGILAGVTLLLSGLAALLYLFLGGPRKE